MIVTFADLITQAHTKKIFLVEIIPSQRLIDWTLYSGSVYYADLDPTVHEVQEVYEDGEALSEAASLGSISAGEWYFNGRRLYVECSSGTPFSKTIVAEYGYYFSNEAVTFNDHFYEPYIKDIPRIKQNKADLFWGVSIYSNGKVTLFNDGTYDNAFGEMAWNNRSIDILVGGEDLPYSEYVTMFAGLVQDKQFTTSSITLTFEDRKKSLEDSLDLNYFTSTVYGDLDPADEGKPIPRIWGSCYNVPVVCTNKMESSATAFDFKIADTSTYGIQTINAVYVNGISVTFTNENDASATFKLANTVYAPGDEVTADLGGYESWGNTLVEDGDCESETIPHLTNVSAALTFCTSTRSVAHAHAGTYSHKLTVIDTGGEDPHIDFTGPSTSDSMHGMTAGKKAKVGIWVKLITGEGIDYNHVELVFSQYIGASVSEEAVSPVNLYDEWQYLEIERTLDESTTSVEILMRIASGAVDDNLYYDDLEVYAYNDLIDNPVKVTQHLCEIMGVTDSQWDTDARDVAEADAEDFPVGLVVNAYHPVIDDIAMLMKSCMGNFYANNEGKYAVSIWQTDMPADPDTIDELDIANLIARADVDNIRRVVRCGWRKNWNDETYAYAQKTSEETEEIYGITRSRSTETLLSTAAAAEVWNSRMLLIYENATLNISFTHKLLLAEKNIGDRFQLSFRRRTGDANIDWMDGRYVEIQSIEKDFGKGEIRITVDDLKGIGASIGHWTDDPPVFSAEYGGGSAETYDPDWPTAKKNYALSTFGYWTDDDGFLDTSDPESYKQSRWW